VLVAALLVTPVLFVLVAALLVTPVLFVLVAALLVTPVLFVLAHRQGDELRIRPARRRMGDVLSTFAQFSPDFMSEGRGLSIEGEREPL